jgi:uncharacterized SAM-binding protein YcdF (DUF218 family)
MRRLLILLLVLVAAWVAASLALFVFPRQDAPRHADAVVVLAGSRRERLPKALELMRRGVAPVLLISGGRDPRWKQAHPYCAGTSRFRTICFDAKPFSTRGEAETVARMARKRGWRSVVVVTSTYHVFRARMLFRRCFDGRVQAVGGTPRPLGWAFGVLFEWPKLAYALTTRRSC